MQNPWESDPSRVPLLFATWIGSLLSGVIWERVSFFWGDFALSYALFLITSLWFIESTLELCLWLRKRQIEPARLIAICGKWLLWVSILFVTFSLRRFDPILSVLSSSLEIVVLLTQSLYIVRAAARLMGNSLASRVLRVFENQLEHQVSQALHQLQQVTEEKESLKKQLDQLQQNQEQQP